MKFCVVLAILIASVAGAPTNDDTRIVGTSSDADLGKYPWAVAITENKKAICGGFIYNDQTIVTTASCANLIVSPYTEFEVLAGTVDAASPQAERALIESVLAHEDYDSTTKKNNIAIIKLKAPLKFSVNIDRILYGSVDLEVTNGEVTGWGSTDPETTEIPSQTLRVATVSNFNGDCGWAGKENFVKSFMICAGDPTSSPCNFDEGAPLVQTTGTTSVLVGLVSNYEKCDVAVTSYRPAIYTRVGSYYDWLITNIGYQS